MPTEIAPEMRCGISFESPGRVLSSAARPAASITHRPEAVSLEPPCVKVTVWPSSETSTSSTLAPSSRTTPAADVRAVSSFSNLPRSS